MMAVLVSTQIEASSTLKQNNDSLFHLGFELTMGMFSGFAIVELNTMETQRLTTSNA